MTKKEEYITVFNKLIEEEIFANKLKLVTELDNGFEFSEICLNDIYYATVSDKEHEKEFTVLVHHFTVDEKDEEIDFPDIESDSYSVYSSNEYKFFWDIFNGVDVYENNPSSLAILLNHIDAQHILETRYQDLLLDMKNQEQNQLAENLLIKTQLCFPGVTSTEPVDLRNIKVTWNTGASLVIPIESIEEEAFTISNKKEKEKSL